MRRHISRALARGMASSLGICALLGAMPRAFAQTALPAATPEPRPEPELRPPLAEGSPKVDFLLGVSLGGVASLADDLDVESDKYGFLTSGSALFSLYTRRVSLDLGVGWMFNRVSGTPVEKVSPRGPDREFVRTRTGFGDFSARFNLGDADQLGGVGIVTYGTDSSFSPWNEGKVPQVFAGLRYLRLHRAKDLSFRYGVDVLTDLTISHRQVTWAALTVQVGLPIYKPEPVTKVEVRVKEVVKYETKEVSRFVFTFDSEIVNFETGKATLSENSRDLLQDLSVFLRENSQIWESLEVGGHTDIRGSKELNDRLSQDRADAVRGVMVRGGLEASRVSAKGYGFSRPLDMGDSETALARNRRVEIVFKGLKDFDRMSAGINAIKNRYRKPENCGADGCK